MQSSPAAVSRPSSPRLSRAVLPRRMLSSRRAHQGSSTRPDSPIRSTSSGRGARCPTRARVATGASPHMTTAARPAARPVPWPWLWLFPWPWPWLWAEAGAAPLAVMGLLSCNSIVQFNTYISAGALIAAGLVNAAAADLARLSAVLRDYDVHL